MEFAKKSLGIYAYMQTFGLLFIAIIITIIAIIFLYKTYKSNYIQSPSSKVGYYTTSNLNECNDYEIKNNLCKLQLVYSDGTNIYKNDIPPNTNTFVGNTVVFYEQQNPKSYYRTLNPYIYPGICCCVACIMYIIIIIRLIIMNSNKNGAAILGAIDIASNVVSDVAHQFTN